MELYEQLPSCEQVEARARFKQFMALWLEVDLERLTKLLEAKDSKQEQVKT